MSEERLHELIRLLKQEGLTEITVSKGDERWTVKQELHGIAAHIAPQPAGSGKADVQEPVDDGTFELGAPLVGTFYARPNPDDEPFVQAGSIVEAGAVVAIIEAMKVMNEVRAEEPGRVRRILIEDGTPVEYGQGLILFEKL